MVSKGAARAFALSIKDDSGSCRWPWRVSITTSTTGARRWRGCSACW